VVEKPGDVRVRMRRSTAMRGEGEADRASPWRRERKEGRSGQRLDDWRSGSMRHREKESTRAKGNWRRQAGFACQWAAGARVRDLAGLSWPARLFSLFLFLWIF
jgi:hypothetical protein